MCRPPLPQSRLTLTLTLPCSCFKQRAWHADLQLIHANCGARSRFTLIVPPTPLSLALLAAPAASPPPPLLDMCTLLHQNGSRPLTVLYILM